MKQRKKRGLCFLPLETLVKARRDANKYKSLFSQEFVNRALAEAKVHIAKLESSMSYSFYEWLNDYALQSKSIEELQEWKEKFKDFKMSQWKRYEEMKKEKSVVRLCVNGRNRTYKVDY